MIEAGSILIGEQDFASLREQKGFLVDKTNLIKEWVDRGDRVTLLTRPRRFGKTLNMSMLECFFSKKYAGRGEELFGGLSIWEMEEYRKLQGQYPVIFLSFAAVKESTFEGAYIGLCNILLRAYMGDPELESRLTEDRKDDFRFMKQVLRTQRTGSTIPGRTMVKQALGELCGFLEEAYGTKPMVFLDEYDTPMQEAWIFGYWDEWVEFIRTMFNAAFKTNSSLGRAILTGITRVSKESIFSDLNNLNVVSITSNEYADCFGFSEEEVFAAMDAMGRLEKERVRAWYDGFQFGNRKDIYNPWSITMYLRNGKLDTYWVNTSSNGLVNQLLAAGDKNVQEGLLLLMSGEVLYAGIDEQIVFSDLSQEHNANAIWSLFAASGYLKVVSFSDDPESDVDCRSYGLAITNRETKRMFSGMIQRWFDRSRWYNSFVEALLSGDLEKMNVYMNEVAQTCFSTFDTGNKPSERAEPERFYHGFVLGLLVETSRDYEITSNRESGLGRYDVCFRPKDMSGGKPAILMEFKVFDEKKEKSLSDTVRRALEQIKEKQYETELIAAGMRSEDIHKYGFAFRGKEVLIGRAI